MAKHNHKEKSKSLRATNLELFSRDIAVSESSKIYTRDADNLYPLRIEKIINNSPTARRCANLMSKYIAGNGVENNIVLNLKENRTLNSVISEAATSIAKQYGVYFLIKYKFDLSTFLDNSIPDFTIADVKVLDYVPMAKSKEDDDSNDGKFYALKVDSDGYSFSDNLEDAKSYYPFNRNSKVILRQMYADCKAKGIDSPTGADLIRNYSGQVFYLNLTPEYTYALPLVDMVYDDCDTEYRIATYNNTQTRTGFLGKTLVKKYSDDEEEDEEFNDDLKDFLGCENAANAFIVEVPQTVEDLDAAFKVEQLEPQFDDKLFESTVKSIRQNIMGAFNNIPEALVFAGSGSLFGTSAGTYEAMKKFYWEQNELERSKLEETFKLFGFDVSIRPLVQENTIDEDAAVNKKAQAELRGSVGGVTALLEVQKSVSEGITDIEAAVAIINVIYGIDEDKARQMLGNPTTTQTNQNQNAQ